LRSSVVRKSREENLHYCSANVAVYNHRRCSHIDASCSPTQLRSIDSRGAAGRPTSRDSAAAAVVVNPADRRESPRPIPRKVGNITNNVSKKNRIDCANDGTNVTFSGNTCGDGSDENTLPEID